MALCTAFQRAHAGREAASTRSPASAPAFATAGIAGGLALALFATGLLLAAPATAGTLYHWRTEDGTHAFADDLKRVPKRYRDQVERRETRSLRGYERFTPQDEAAAAEYARQLDERVERLRAFNRGETRGDAFGGDAADDAFLGDDAAAFRARRSAAAPERVEVRISNEGDPVVRMPAHGVSEPVVIEKIRMIPDGANVTRTNTIVRQGDRILTIVKPQVSRTSSVFFDEESEIEGRD